MAGMAGRTGLFCRNRPFPGADPGTMCGSPSAGIAYPSLDIHSAVCRAFFKRLALPGRGGPSVSKPRYDPSEAEQGHQV